jgi:hypothetical protein
MAIDGKAALKKVADLTRAAIGGGGGRPGSLPNARAPSADGWLGQRAPLPEPEDESGNDSLRRLADNIRAQQARDAAEANTWRADTWFRSLTETQRFAIRLSLAVEKRDPALAADIRSLMIEQSKVGALGWPRCEWWKGMNL